MKNRKHKSNHWFRIHFRTESPSQNLANVCAVSARVERGVVLAQGISAGAVRRGFLFGRDRNNTTFNIQPA